MNKKYFLTLLISVLFSSEIFSTTYTSATNGNWMNFMTWTPFGVPIPGDIVIINHAVVMDTSFVYSTGSITVNSSGSLIHNGAGRDLWLNGVNATFTNHGTTTMRYMLLDFGTFTNTGTLNVKALQNSVNLSNTGTMQGIDSLYNKTGNLTNNGTMKMKTFYNQNIWHNYGTIEGLATVVDSMYNLGTFQNYSGAILKADSATNNGVFTNNGTIEYAQFTNFINGNFTNNSSFTFVDMTNAGIFTNTGMITGTNDMWNNEVFNNQSMGIINLNNSFLNADSINNTATFTNDGIVTIGDSYYNFNLVTGSNTGSFTVQDSSVNAGNMTGSFDFCDQTPPVSPIKIDYNYGSVDPTITYCLASSVQDIISHTYIVYPNPTSGIVSIGNQQQFIEVYSIDGKLLLQDFTNQINFGNHQSGLYFLIIKDKEGNQLYTEKLIKE